MWGQTLVMVMFVSLVGCSDSDLLFLARKPLSSAIFTVMYNANGAESGALPPGLGSYAPGATVVVAGNPGSLTRTGYYFAGWNTAADGTGTSYIPGNTFSMPGRQVILYALWWRLATQVTFTVNYDANGAESGTLPPGLGSYAPGATVVVAGNPGSLTRTGYYFTGWNTAADGTGTSYAEGNTLSMPGAPLNLFAVWVDTGSLSLSGTTISKGITPPSGVLIIPPGVTSIDTSGFSSCNALTTLVCPSSVTTIGNDAFSNCDHLVSVTLPQGLTSLGEYAFYGCVSLTSINLPPAMATMGKGIFGGCTSLTQVTLAEGSPLVAQEEFSGCTALTQITIPASVTSFEYNAFGGCTSLTSVTVKRSIISGSIPTLGSDVFYGCHAALALHVPSDSVGTYVSDWAASLSGCGYDTSIISGF